MNTSFIKRVVAVAFAILLVMSSLVIIVGEEKIPDECTDEVNTESSSAEVPLTTEPTTVETPLNDVPLLHSELAYFPTDTIGDAEELRELVFMAVDSLTYEVSSGKYTKGACDEMEDEIARLSRVIMDIDAHIEELKLWENRYGEYPYATRLWKYLKLYGYSDAVCAGILGNFMAETGGHTLYLRPNMYNSTGNYYGMAQWSVKYYPDVVDKDFEYQCEYLIHTIRQEFDTFGYLYKKGFDYQEFLKLESPEEAALAFAKCYERCHHSRYGKRQDNAVTAYDYFT